MTDKIILAILQIFGVFFVGWGARHLRYINEMEINRWSRVAIDILMPLLVFHSIVTGFKADRLGTLWPLPILGLGIIVFGALCGIALRRGMWSKDENLRKTFHHFCAINNYGYLPIIIVQSLWGTEGVARLFFLNLGSSIGYWTIGVGVLGDSGVLKRLKKILTPNLITLAVALGLCLLGWNRHVPTLVLDISERVGSAAVPLILLLIGASLYPLPSIRHKRDLIYLTAVRLVLLPACIITVLILLPLHPDVRNIAFIVALMPGTVSSTIITRRYGGSPTFAARAAIVTTLVSIVTIPAGLMLLESFAKF